MQYVTFTHAPILRASTTVGVRSKAQSPRARSSRSQWVGVCAFAPKTEGRFAWGKGKRTNLVCARGGFGNILHLHYCTLRACCLGEGEANISVKGCGLLAQQQNFTYGGILNLILLGCKLGGCKDAIINFYYLSRFQLFLDMDSNFYLANCYVTCWVILGHTGSNFTIVSTLALYIFEIY